MKIIKSLAIYYLLTILLLALVPILSALFGISMDFESIAVKASEQSGILWTSNLINVIRLSLIEPGLWLLILGSFVPTLAALVVLLWTRDRTGLRTLLRRFNPLGISHVSIKRAISNYALLIGVPCTASGSKAIDVAFEFRFPFRFQHELNQGLTCPVLMVGIPSGRWRR